MEPLEGTVFVEEIFARAGKWRQLRALAAARLAPSRLLCRGQRTPDSLAAVIFSSGSTGVPKGVMLSHYNVLSNVEAIAQLFWIGPDDRIVSGLPLFHSFGFTVAIWFPLIAGCGVVYHTNPADAKTIGELAGWADNKEAIQLIYRKAYVEARQQAFEEFAFKVNEWLDKYDWQMKDLRKFIAQLPKE